MLESTSWQTQDNIHLSMSLQIPICTVCAFPLAFLLYVRKTESHGHPIRAPDPELISDDGESVSFLLKVTGSAT